MVSIRYSFYISRSICHILDDGIIAINPDRFDKLITALRTAVDNDGTRQRNYII